MLDPRPQPDDLFPPRAEPLDPITVVDPGPTRLVCEEVEVEVLRPLFRNSRGMVLLVRAVEGVDFVEMFCPECKRSVPREKRTTQKSCGFCLEEGGGSADQAPALIRGAYPRYPMRLVGQKRARPRRRRIRQWRLVKDGAEQREDSVPQGETDQKPRDEGSPHRDVFISQGLHREDST
jgi:hypothetical protein